MGNWIRTFINFTQDLIEIVLIKLTFYCIEVSQRFERSFSGFISVLFMCFYNIKILNSQVVKDQWMKKGLSICSSVDLCIEHYSLGETGLVGCTNIEDYVLALFPPLAPSTVLPTEPVRAWTLGPDWIQYPEGRGGLLPLT